MEERRKKKRKKKKRVGLQRHQQTSISININIRFADSNRAGKHGGFKKKKKKRRSGMNARVRDIRRPHLVQNVQMRKKKGLK